MATNDDSPSVRLDAMMPVEIASQAEEIGVRKARLPAVTTLVLAILAGGFIAIGAVFATTVTTGGPLPYGVTRLLAGLAFATGLVMVVVGGAELFTGNVLIVMAFASGRIGWGSLLRSWTIVYLGNLIGAVLTAYGMFLAQQHLLAGAQMGVAMLRIGEAKTALAFLPALVSGIFCNALVCMAVWMCYGTRTTTGRVLAIVPPIAAFVAAGFEHCVANMYFIPVALFVKQLAGPSFFGLASVGADAFPHLTWERFIVGNLLPVTIGNIIGGGLLVGGMYWFAYLRGHPRHTRQDNPSA